MERKNLTLLNGEAAALEPYRRLRFSASDATKCLYADALDYTNWQFVSKAAVGDKPAVGGRVDCEFATTERSIKIEAAGAISAGADVYAADDGKVTATPFGPPIGKALTTTTASGGICEVLPAGGFGPRALTITQSLSASGDTAINKPNWKTRIEHAFFVARDTGAANFKLKNGSTDITDAVAKGTVNDAIKNFASYVTAQQTLLAADTLNGNLSAAQAVELFITFIPV